MNRKGFLLGSGALISLPSLTGDQNIPVKGKRIVILANQFGMVKEKFFPEEFGMNASLPEYLKPLEWARDNITVFSNTDHGMESGHDKDITFLNGMTASNARNYPNGNMSMDVFISEYTRQLTRYQMIKASVDNRYEGYSISFTRNGVALPTTIGAENLYNQLFTKQTKSDIANTKKEIQKNRDFLRVAQSQHKTISRKLSKNDKDRFDQYADSITDLHTNMDIESKWLDIEKENVEKPSWNDDLNSEYNAIFDMLTLAFQSDMTRVATVTFPRYMPTQRLGLSEIYHTYTHHGFLDSNLASLGHIESFQIKQLSRFMKKLSEIKEPNSNETMLDNTIILFGSGMGYGVTHNNRNLPILVTGGGLNHQVHRSLLKNNGENTRLCNLYLSLIQKIRPDVESFNVSNGTVEI